MSATENPLGRCPCCKDDGVEADLVAVMSDDGSAFEAEGCMSCGRSWWNNPPKHAAPDGSEALTIEQFDARRVELRAARSAGA
jgi:hypothetical protein